MSLLKDKIELGIAETEFETEKLATNLPAWVKWAAGLFLLVIIPSYFIAKEISYKVWQGRFTKILISAKPSFSNAAAPTIATANVTTLEAGQYAGVVQISNPNLNLSLENVPFNFIFFNSQGQQVYSYPSTLYLLPNETKYIIAPTFSSNEQIVSAQLQLPTMLPWQKRLQIPTVNLETSPPGSSTQKSPPAFVVQGDLVNNSPYGLEKVTLTFVIFDGSGKIVGESSRDEFTVEPFERRSYTQLWPDAFVANPGRVQVSADTDTLDPNNITLPNFPSSPASSLSHSAGGQGN